MYLVLSSVGDLDTMPYWKLQLPPYIQSTHHNPLGKRTWRQREKSNVSLQSVRRGFRTSRVTFSFPETPAKASSEWVRQEGMQFLGLQYFPAPFFLGESIRFQRDSISCASCASAQYTGKGHTSYSFFRISPICKCI